MISALSYESFFDLASFEHSELFSGCHYVWEVLPKIKHYLGGCQLGHIRVGIPDGVHLFDKDRISIGKGTIVEPGAYIHGPCIIGENCTIRQGSYIRGNVIVGNQCVIGHTTEMKNALMLNQANAAHFAYLGDSILGNRVNLGAGAKCANLRFDHKMIEIVWNSQRLSTGLKKFGAIFGDDTQIGCNAVTNPGTITGKGVNCYPCVNFGGVIPAGSVVKMSQEAVIV